MQGKALFAIVTSLRKSRSIRYIEKVMLSLNLLDTQESVVSVCAIVREAPKLRTLCTFYSGVTIKWAGDGRTRNEKEKISIGNAIVAYDEKKCEEIYRLPRSEMP